MRCGKLTNYICKTSYLKAKRQQATKSTMLALGLGVGVAYLFAVNSLNAQSMGAEIQRMLDNHPELLSIRQKIFAATASMDEAKSNFFPTLSLSGEAGANQVSNESTRDQDIVDPIDYSTLTVTLRQNLFEGNATVNNLEAKEHSLLSAELAYKVAVQKSIADATKAYLELMRAEELLEISKRKQDTIREQMELEDERVRSGSGVTVDVLQAKSRLQKAINESYNYERRRNRALAAYENAFGFMPEENKREDDISQHLLVPSSLEQAVDIARNDHPKILRSLADVESSQSQIDVAGGGYAPVVDLVASNEWGHDANGIEDDRTITTKAYLEMSWDLFSGFWK